MATAKKKKATKVRDLKPTKDAKGGKTRHDLAGGPRANRPNKNLY